jgi:osmotically-inducible protein OsmY
MASAKNDEVTVSGTVPNRDQLDQIEPLALEVEGVRSVVVEAVIDPQ